jgi:thiol-disulfide isomerase/thioredoxin
MSEKAGDDGRHQAGELRTRRLVPRLVLAALLLLVVAGAVRLVARRVDPAASGGLTVADQLAVDSNARHRVVEFHGVLLADGRPWSSLSARGQVLVVNFWASWCGPCRAEQPGLSQVAHTYRDRGVRFIGVNIQDTKSAARAYVEEFHVRYPSLFDPAALTATRLQAVALPTTFILDRDGVVAFQLTGKTTPPILAARLDALLGHGGRRPG